MKAALLAVATPGGVVTSVVTGATVSTVNARGAVAALLPAASVTCTVIVWPPSASAAVVCEAAVVHGAAAPPSTLHAVVAGAPAVTNAKVGVLSLVASGSIGPPVNATVGATVSIVNGRGAVVAVLPTASETCSWIVCGPSASAAVVCEVAVEQAPNAPASTLHRVEVAEPPIANVKVGAVSLVGVGSIGPPVKATVGAVVSTVQVNVVVAPRLPAASRARTWNVWLPSARPA